jgi:hypothetical protein
VGARAESAVSVTACVVFDGGFVSIVASVGPPARVPSVCRLEGSRPAAAQPGLHSSASLAAPRRHHPGNIVLSRSAFSSVSIAMRRALARLA